MNKLRNSIIAVALSMGASVEASAESKWYAGLSAGSVSTDVTLAALDNLSEFVLFSRFAARQGSTSSFDESSTAWSVFGGRRITQHLAIEAGYVRLGEISYRSEGEFTSGGFFGGPYIPLPGPPIYYPGSSMAVEIEHSAVTLKLVGRLPIAKRFDVHAQAGAVHAMTEASYSATIARSPPTNLSDDADSNTTDFLYGIGATFKLAPRWDLTLDWHRYEVKDDDSSPFDIETSYDTITLGLIFSFGAQ